MTTVAARRVSTWITSNGPIRLQLHNQDMRRRRSRLRFGIAAFGLAVVAGFFAIAFVQAQMVADQQDLDQLRAQIEIAEKDRARLARSVDEASSPEAIVARAQAMGMVRATEPIYLAAVSPAPEITVPNYSPPVIDGSDDLIAQAVIDPSTADGATASSVSGSSVSGSSVSGSSVSGSSASGSSVSGSNLSTSTASSPLAGSRVNAAGTGDG